MINLWVMLTREHVKKIKSSKFVLVSTIFLVLRSLIQKNSPFLNTKFQFLSF